MTASKKQIADRQAYVEKIIRFVHHLLNAEGKVLKRQEYSSHYYSLRELELDSFKFMDEGAFTMFGGEEVTIWYQSWKVFQVKYWDIKKCEVLEFDTNMPCPDWQTPLKKLMRVGAVRTAAKVSRAKKKIKTHDLNAMQRVKAQMDLETDARRLHV